MGPPSTILSNKNSFMSVAQSPHPPRPPRPPSPETSFSCWPAFRQFVLTLGEIALNKKPFIISRNICEVQFFVTEFLLLTRSMTMTVDQEVEAGISRSEKGFLWKSFQTWCQQNASKVNKVVSIRLNKPSSGRTGPGFRLDKYFAM